MNNTFDPHAAPSPDLRRRTMFWAWAVRAGRREYAIHVALLCAVGFALGRSPAAGLALTVVWALVMVRRVHDFGRSAWWAVGAMLLPFFALPLFYLAGEDVTLVVATIIEMAAVIGIGAVPGEPGENRFGPPPPFTFRRVMLGR